LRRGESAAVDLTARKSPTQSASAATGRSGLAASPGAAAPAKSPLSSDAAGKPALALAPPHPSTARLPGELAKVFEEAWQGFYDACAERDMLFLSALARVELPVVWAASEFVAGACVRAPALLEALIDSGALDRRGRGEDLIARIKSELADCADEEDLDARLRRLRRREMVRMAWRDLSGAGDLEETIEGVSALAEGCIDAALAHHHRWLSARFGTPRDGDGNAVGMVVLGLGKLGGGELNYSSDIDLIFAYEHAGQTAHDAGDHANADNANASANNPGTLDNHEYFTRLGRKLIASLERTTADGFVFRVDMRLRPNGDSGPLALSFAAMEQYYQSHGRDWERYALIKARTVGGDRDAGARLQQQLTPFIYRKYLDFTAFDSIREMKKLIEREVKKKGMEDNVKLGPGGIREIEFLVQSHQLIRGGRNRNLRTQSLHKALRVLAEEGIVDQTARAQLLDDYRFLRNTEHRVQMVADRQTQRLPEAPFARLRLAWSMGFESWDAYCKHLAQRRAHVERAFGEILGAPPAVGAGRGAAVAADSEAALADVWRNAARAAAEAAGPAAQSTLDALTAAGFTDSTRVARLLKDFRAGQLYQMFSANERDRVDRLIPLALRQAGGREHPERALTAFISVLESIGRRSVYLSLLIENPPALAQLISLCAASAWISRHIGAHPVVMDELLGPPVDVRKRELVDIRRELKRRLAQAGHDGDGGVDGGDDEETRMTALREFNHAQVLRVAAADVTGVLDAFDACRALSQVARVILQQVFDDALRWVAAKHGGRAAGGAGNEAGDGDAPYQAGVIAYGKFAAGELGYHSDLDIVVCYDAGDGGAGDGDGAGDGKNVGDGDSGGDGKNTGADNAGESHADLGYFYARVGQRLVHLLTARTHAGPLYELDMRLRPSGQSGTLVTSLDGFAKYQLDNAWTWEHQALVRARAVAGGDVFSRRFERVRRRVLCRPREADKLRADIASMKAKMARANSQSDEAWFDLKLGAGGIVDIEFIVQFLVLRAAHEHPFVVRPRTTVETIDALREAGALADDAARQLQRIYRLYLRKSLDLKLMAHPLRVRRAEFVEEREWVEMLWAGFFGDGDCGRDGDELRR